MERSFRMRARAVHCLIGGALAGFFTSCSRSEPASELAPQVGERSQALVTAISTCAELQAMENDLSGDYQLAQDIDCQSFDPEGNGKGFRPVGVGGWIYTPFEGHFDGAGHVIRNLTIHRPLEDSVGLFGLAGPAVIERVGLEDASIVGYEAVGAVVGATEGTLVREVYATGTISGHLSGSVVGFLKHEGILRDSYSRLTVDWTGQGGLLCDYLYYDAQLERSYSAGTGDEGRLYGDIGEGGDVLASFFDCTVAGDCGNEGGQSTANLKSQTFLEGQGWDFTNTWAMSSVDGYPCLRWQAGCGTSCTPTGPDTDCDGQDDDCDGTADDEYVSQSTHCGTGACARTGSTSCVSGSVEDSCSPGTPAASDATCDGLDDDCDGADDEDYASQPTTCGIGACSASGSLGCVSGSVQDTCTPGTPAGGDFTCDGTDDDCDGVADEDYEPAPTTCGLGACATLGVTSCVAGQVQKSCTAGTPATDDADCDGADDDCDGAIDEDYPTAAISCGTGACARQGSRSCAAGTVVEFCQPGAAAGSDDTCDGVDSDCDGDVDEDYVGASTRCGVGACEASGALVCSGGQLADTCRPGVPASGDLTCDGIDEDCDGTADEDAVAFEMGCGTGACTATAMVRCVAGTWVGGCAPLPPLSLDDTCDGIDDDCDGALDDDFVPAPVTCGLGACANVGVTACVAGTVIESCIPWPALTATGELCDGVDSDCDGVVDENFVVQSSCGTGVCARTGTRTCAGGEVVDSCVPGAPDAAQDTSCNGLDDDCDGDVDEDFSGACDGTSAQICVDGQLVNQTECSDGVFCNGTESCSAGACVRMALAIDDGNPCTIDACTEAGGVTHTDLPFGASCSDGDACNGMEVCVPCLESENLLVNASFERVWTPIMDAQGFLPTDWWSTSATPDTYSFDGSWGLPPTAYTNFANVQSVPDGMRWIAGAAGYPESFAQELREPLVPGQRYRLTAKMHEAARQNIAFPGGYEVALSSDYTVTSFRPNDAVLGRIGTTAHTLGWVDVGFEFTAPGSAGDKLLLNFVPYTVNSTYAYPGLDLVKLVRACSTSGAYSCQRQEAPMVDDGNPCTQDSCEPSTGALHTLQPTGSACNGTGTCTAAGECTNHPPVITNLPPPYYVMGAGPYTHQVTAIDPDGDPITFVRGGGAVGNWTISPSGLVGFSNLFTQIYIFSIEARDDRGGVAKQRRLFQGIDGEPSPPMVPSQPTQHFVRVGHNFSYQIRFWQQDPNATASFAFDVPPPDGMSMSPTGLLTWTPDIAALGTHEVSVQITTGSQVVIHTFMVSVTEDVSSVHFTTTPVTRVAAGSPYSYFPTALFGDQAVPVRLDVRPAGMVQDPNTGAILWTPTQEQVGAFQVALTATWDGASATQQFAIEVLGTSDNRPPVLEVPCMPTAPVGTPLVRVVGGYDPEGTPLTFFAVGLPSGASIDATTGIVTWLPSAAFVGRTLGFRVGARDATGLQTVFDFYVAVVPAASGPNRAPQITSTPPASAKVGIAYSYQLTAVDPDGDAVQFTAPMLPAGSTFDAAAGTLSWMPAATGPASLAFTAADSHGNTARQEVTIQVQSAAANLPPAITSTPPTTAVLYEDFEYAVSAFDPEGEPFGFSLQLAPDGMFIDPLTGVLDWTPTYSGFVDVQVSVRDARGATTIQSFRIQVAMDVDGPEVLATTVPSPPRVGQPARIDILVEDAGALVGVEVILDGQAVQLDANGGFDRTFTAIGFHELIVRAGDAAGNLTVRTFQIGVIGASGVNHAPVITSSPLFNVMVGVPYTYQLTAEDEDGDPLLLSAPTMPPGATFNTATGGLLWTPAQAGAATFAFKARDPLGSTATQEVTLVAQQPAVNRVPQIISTPPAQGFAGEPFQYDVNAFDPEGAPVTYSLLVAPSGMTIDAQTGLIDWMPNAGGEFDVEVSAQDPGNGVGTQTFRIDVWADGEAPLVIVNSAPRYPRVNESTRITVDIQDEGPVSASEVLLDGVPVTLDANGGITTAFTEAGRHEVVVHATDSAGNHVSQTHLIGVSADGTPALAPVVTIHDVADDEVVTLQKTVTVSVSDDDLLSYRVSLVDAGDRSTEVRLLHLGSAPATSLAAGTIDATQLINGYYVLRLEATDFAGHTSRADVPFKIEGGAKIGVVQLSLVDAVIAATGFDLQVVRSYDSRRAHSQGDFGFGWELDLKGPRVRSNRPIGEGYGIWNTGGPFSLPCNAQGESRSHFTEVRISDEEFYVFSPSVANVQAVSGTCMGQVVFDQVDGSAIGAELVIVGADQVYPSRKGAGAAGMNLVNVWTGELYDADHFQLSTPDGRLFDLTATGGLNWVQDANGNTLSVRPDHVSHSDGPALGFVRDGRGRISAVRMPDGSSLSYTYDGAGDLRATTTAQGFRTRYEYAANAPHHLSKMIDPEGVEQGLFSYDASGRLMQSCGAENHCVALQHDLVNQTEWFIDGEEALQHTYDARGNVLTETNALNETWTYTYDAHDRMLTSLSPLNELTTYSYDRNGNLLAKVEPHEASENAADFTTAYTYGALDRRTSMTLPSGGVLSWEYDGRGNEVAMRDGSSNVLRSRAYDPYGRLTQETNRFGTWQYGRSPDGTVRTITDPQGRVTTLRADPRHGLLVGQQEGGVQMGFSRDRDLRMVRADYGNGVTVSYEYTGSSKQWSAITGPTFGRVERHFWADGKLARVTEPNGDVREFYYDANRRLLREVDALGHDTLYTRNTAGRVTQIREAVTGAETEFTHDAAGRVLTRTDALNRTTAMTYRAGGRLASVTDARNHTRTFSETPTSRTVVDALSRTTVRQLNAYGLTTATSLPGGTSTALSYLGQTRSDESQRFPLSVSDEGSRPRSYGYDAHGGMASASDLGGQNAWEYDYALTRGGQVTWDAESGEVQLVPVDARANAYEFSAQGDLLKDSSEAFIGDGLFTSELRTVRTPRGDVTTFERDSSGRPSRVTLPWGAQKTYSYTDADANPERVTLPQGTTLTYTYDAAKREVSRTSSAGEGRSFVYGPNDRLESMTDATGTTTYEYDAAGRFAGIVYPHGGSVRYVRDLLGRTVRQEVRATASAAPLVTQYAYDEVGNLSEVIDPQNGSTTFVYDAENRLETRTLPNGVVTSYTYDARDRPLSVVHRNASNVVLVSRTYVRAAGGEPTRITKEDGSYVDIGYDAALRITSERYYTASGVLEDELGYTYDADGNRLTKTRDGVVSTYSYAAGSRLMGVSTEGELEARVTDNGGRETAIVVDGQQLSLTYDSDDHVTRVVDGSGTTELAFDAAGRRVGVTTASVTKRFLTAPNAGNGYESPQAITDGTGAVLASYVFAGQMPLAKTTSAGTDYYLADAMGSVIGTAGSIGSLVSTVEYDAFGNELDGAAVPSATHGDFRLHGMWKDPSGLYYVRARVYDAESGRFTTLDPAVGIATDPNTYAPYSFCNNNPGVWQDPNGEFAAFSGAVLGASFSLSTVAVAGFKTFLFVASAGAAAAAITSAVRTRLNADDVVSGADLLYGQIARLVGSALALEINLAKGGIQKPGDHHQAIRRAAEEAVQAAKEAGKHLNICEVLKQMEQDAESATERTAISFVRKWMGCKGDPRRRGK